MAPPAVIVALCPAQIEVLVALTVGAGVTVTVETEDAEQPDAIPVTVHVVVDEGVTEMELTVAPVFHKYAVAPVAVSVVVSPLQIDGELTLITGNAVTLTVPDAVDEHPLVVPVTV